MALISQEAPRRSTDTMLMVVNGIRGQVGVEAVGSAVATKTDQLGHAQVATGQRVTSSGLGEVPVVAVGDGRDSFSTRCPTLPWS